MIADQEPPPGLIWATRGRSWGYRFLLKGGLADPLREYERAFATSDSSPTTWHRAVTRSALRFPDPLGRRDASNRIIPHEFVLLGNTGDAIQSAEEGQKLIWPLVAGVYVQIWEAEDPPSITDLHFST